MLHRVPSISKCLKSHVCSLNKIYFFAISSTEWGTLWYLESIAKKSLNSNVIDFIQLFQVNAPLTLNNCISKHLLRGGRETYLENREELCSAGLV